jgi:hypothetical protein
MIGIKEIIRKFDENNYIVEFAWQDGTFNYSAVIDNVQGVYMYNDAMEAYNELVKAGK